MVLEDKLLRRVIRKWMLRLIERLSENEMDPLKRAYLTGRYRALNEVREIIEEEMPVLKPTKKNQ